MDTGGTGTLLRVAPALALAGCLAALPAPARAQEAVLELTPADTRIDFTLWGFPHSVEGTFKLTRGTMRVDLATGTADGLLIVDATSGDSGGRSRDAEMRESVLEAQRYPEIRFTPQHVDGQVAPQGEFRVTIRGLLWLHGKGHDITWDMLVRLAGEEWTATTHFVVPYVEWGMTDPSIFIFRVADKVEIAVSASGRVAWTPAGGTKSGGAPGGPEP